MSTTPESLPTLAQVEGAVDQTTFLGERAKRIYATMRWAGVIAVVELRDGYEAAMEVVETGPERFLPTDEEFANINGTSVKAINYIEGGK